MLRSPHDPPTAATFPWARWAAWGALLVAEGLILTLYFDTETLASQRQWWAGLLRQAPLGFRFGIVATAATFLCDSIRGRFRPLDEYFRPPPHSWLFALGHLAAFAGFACLTALVLGEGMRSSPFAGGWVVAWATLGMATLALWGAAVLPPRGWRRLVRRGAGAVLRGAAVGTAACGAGFLSEWLWQPLGLFTFWLVSALLRRICSEIVCSSAEGVVGTPSFTVAIAPSCSGYDGIGLIWVFVGVYLWLFRHRLRFPRAWLLLPVGTVLIWLLNALRIAALVAIGTWWSPAVAKGGFHSAAGWLAFNAVGLGLVVLSRRARLFCESEPSPGEARGSLPTTAFLTPLLAVVATAMLTGAFSHGFDRLYPLRVLAAAGALWSFRRDYVGLRWTWSWHALALGVGAFALWMVLEPPPSEISATALSSGWATLPKGWAAAWLSFRVLGAVVTAPLAEELAFRGYLTRRLIAAEFQEVPVGRFSWWSFVLSSALFGVLHGRWLAGTFAGMLYAWALYRRGSMGDALVAHATTNALLAAYVLTTGAWSLWGV